MAFFLDLELEGHLKVLLSLQACSEAIVDLQARLFFRRPPEVIAKPQLVVLSYSGPRCFGGNDRAPCC